MGVYVACWLEALEVADVDVDVEVEVEVDVVEVDVDVDDVLVVL